MVISVEAKRISDNKWEVYTENGRESTGIDVMEWLQESEKLGAGEVLLTSVDCEGTRKGFDINLIKSASSSISIPIIASGGMGKLEDLFKVVIDANADAVAMADVLHYDRLTFHTIRKDSLFHGLNVRKYDEK